MRYCWKHTARQHKRSCPYEHLHVLFHTLKQQFSIFLYCNPILLSDAPKCLSPQGQQGQDWLHSWYLVWEPIPKSKIISAAVVKNLPSIDVPLLLLCIFALQLIFTAFGNDQYFLGQNRLYICTQKQAVLKGLEKHWNRERKDTLRHRVWEAAPRKTVSWT